jgi:hypothetical protein
MKANQNTFDIDIDIDIYLVWNQDTKMHHEDNGAHSINDHIIACSKLRRLSKVSSCFSIQTIQVHTDNVIDDCKRRITEEIVVAEQRGYYS